MKREIAIGVMVFIVLLIGFILGVMADENQQYLRCPIVEPCEICQEPVACVQPDCINEIVSDFRRINYQRDLLRQVVGNGSD